MFGGTSTGGFGSTPTTSSLLGGTGGLNTSGSIFGAQQQPQAASTTASPFGVFGNTSATTAASNPLSLTGGMFGGTTGTTATTTPLSSNTLLGNFGSGGVRYLNSNIHIYIYTERPRF